ncbi:DNA mismatch repair endonuclease MutL [Rubrobacter marinus]|uniref:DNA mismatch repair protein MutL n=1 Tax=Rubrobacter marinus TaxID=2653852 RepID=A0A6G8PRT4_9ACTN|nr:DNA mismatch repair endonuclease MutL [Rubrobacter marinus]QIN77198.1 DNA mismatch repair endonuclease MutL [Rubrobacter marinus]
MGEKGDERASIRVLDPRVAQQVAAGEVVDRPASVVKELVENSLDAGASRVEVELGDGGTSHILVRDDGSGMARDDAALSVLRHATSKLRSVGDLESVATLGFRGEALPSVASVSSFCLTTSTGEGAGTKVLVDGGGEAKVLPASHPRGTTILVDRLFYNVPARRAFLKGPRAERAAIIETLTHLAVAHPKVAFRLSEGGRDYLSLPVSGDGDLLERLAQVHGVAKARSMRKVEYESGAFRVSGYAALPSLTESNRARQTISVNGRWVRAENLTRGIDDAYRSTLPSGRYPPVALRIEVDPRRVDVNVHPTKQVVRFSEERAARAAVAAAVREAIEWRPSPPASVPRPTEPSYSQDRLPSPRPYEPPGRYERVAERRPDYPSPASPLGPPAPRRDLNEVRERLARASRPLSEYGAPRREEAPEPYEPPERGALPRAAVDELRVIGQLAAGYILVEEPGAMWVVDQHVAHERAILDGLTDAEEGSVPTTQALLVPEVVELPPAEAESAEGYLEELAVYGFEAEPFGPSSFRVTAVISTLAGRDVAGAFKEALSAARGTGPGRRREDHILATIACHSAVKLGDKLSQPEMEALVKSWLNSRLPATCPHGRSICFRMGVNEIARKLDRH